MTWVFIGFVYLWSKFYGVNIYGKQPLLAGGGGGGFGGFEI